MDNRYGTFLNILEYKAARRGQYFVKVAWNYPVSQVCHNCGMIHLKMKNLSKRKIHYECGYYNDRDFEGLRIIGLA